MAAAVSPPSSSPAALAIEVEHALPGRLRLRAPAIYRRRDLAAELEKRARRRVPGAVLVRAAPTTATLLVSFASEADPASVVTTIEKVLAGVLGSTADDLEEPATWHRLQTDEALAALDSSQDGLETAAAQKRLRKHGRNVLHVREPRKGITIFFGQLRSVPVALLAGSAVVSLATGGIADAIAILAVVVVNATIGYATESSAERTILALERGGRQTARARRGGELQEIDAGDLVPGDIVVLGPATLVPADLRLLSCEDLTIDESTLTGESAPVAKRASALDANAYVPLAEHFNMAFRGTLVTTGGGLGLVVATGASTELGRIQTMAGDLERPVTPMQAQLARLGTELAILAGGVCAGVFVLGWLRGYGLVPMLQTALSLAVAAVPEGLPTVATTTLALGIRRMRSSGVLVRRLDAIETLGAVQIICFDKTGTVTENRMSVTEAVSGGRRLTSGDEGGLCHDGRLVSPDEDRDLELLLRVLLLCSTTTLDPESGELRGSPTEVALARLAIEAGLDLEELRPRFPLVRVRERSESRMWMDTLHEREDGGKLLAVKGRPTEVLELCDRIQRGEGEHPLDEDERRRIVEDNERMAGDALRVLGIAFAHDEDAVEKRSLIWLGLVAMADPPRPGISESLKKLHSAGIATAMITGDQSATALAIGRRIGLAYDGEGELEALDAEALEQLRPGDLGSVASRVRIFSRVSPAHKLAIVQALQGSGLVVAMTGDGVNDSPALKAADVGVAMGSAGTPTAREVAAVVLRDDDLATILGAVEQGRTIHDDIKKAVHFVLATNLGEILLTVAQVGFGLGRALSPMQLLWINLLTDVLPELALAVQPPESSVLARPPRAKGQPMFTRGELLHVALEGAIITSGAVSAFASRARGEGRERASTMAFTTLTCAQLLHALSARSTDRTIYDLGTRPPRSPYVPASIAATTAVQVLGGLLPGARRILGTVPLSLADWGLVGIGSVLPLLGNEAIKLLYRPRRARGRR